MKLAAYGILTALAVLSGGCGYIGPPLPPALNIPRSITDLRVEEVGDQVVLNFTTPIETTEDLPVTRLRAIELLAAPTQAGGSGTDFSPDRWKAAAQVYMIPADELGPVEHTIPASEWAGGPEIAFAVRTIGTSGRTSDLSGYAFLTVAPPLSKPVVTATNAVEGVALTWTGNAPLYRVERSILSDPEPMLEQIAETGDRAFTDANAAYDVRYGYVVTGLSGGAVRSVPSEAAEILPKDVFPPETPAGLDAVVVGPSIDLSWTRNTEPDLAGYTVLRAVGDAELANYAEGVVLPTFNDPAVQSGQRYRYVVIAVDKLGNQSQRSMEVSRNMP